SLAPCLSLRKKRFGTDSDPSHDRHKFEHGLVRNANRIRAQTFPQELSCDCLLFRKTGIEPIDQNVGVNQGSCYHTAPLASSHALPAKRPCPLSPVDAFAAASPDRRVPGAPLPYALAHCH